MSTKHSVRTVVFDLDGTLADYEGGWETHSTFPGPPIEETREQIIRLKEAGFDVGIYTTRTTQIVEQWLVLYGLKPYVDWVNENPNQPPGCSSKPIGAYYVDDRAVRFENNLAQIVDEILRGGYVPWQEKRNGAG